MTDLGHWKAALPKPGEIYDLAATFARPALRERQEVRLVLPTLGARTSAWVNGRELARDLDTSRLGPDLALDAALLRDGENVVRLLVTPILDGRNRIPETTQLGTVGARTPAAGWKRRAFGGLAQVLVQAGREAGPIAVVATAAGMPPARLILQAARAQPRPSVP
jgi:beta-galactosidase